MKHQSAAHYVLLAVGICLACHVQFVCDTQLLKHQSAAQYVLLVVQVCVWLSYSMCLCNLPTKASICCTLCVVMFGVYDSLALLHVFQKNVSVIASATNKKVLCM